MLRPSRSAMVRTFMVDFASPCSTRRRRSACSRRRALSRAASTAAKVGRSGDSASSAGVQQCALWQRVWLS
eukprot:85921-Prymnesium_polylepis.1